ncbi:MAG: hypothetical protein DSZ23_01685, partial [Thermodesulfatator sp.]
QKSYKGRTLRGASAQDDKVLRSRRNAKCGDCAEKVHVLIGGNLSTMRQQAVISKQLPAKSG